ncbi:A24 family peptidase [Granulicella sibirica]|uniref:Type IV prepilin peptidase TadV/CpaA n=1 Tax=Granulicella sibirica TaxID=2479048 RepID=A0A4Q0SUE7_9BACT|nr:A24 family peptidase [Granulicella sibirica]RXH54337.1 Type IV prepilin peptidase TadV/CpaA [Granulicella sibirica]
MAVPAAFVYLGTALIVASVAAFHDVRERRISNRLTGPSVLTGLLIHFVLGGFRQLGLSLLGGMIAGGIFLFFYLAGGLGAGDVKLMTAVGCITGIGYIRDILLVTVILGAVFAIILAFAHGRVRTTLANVSILLAHHRTAGLTAHPELNLGNRATLRLPYALPIACGCLTVFAMQVFRGAEL